MATYRRPHQNNYFASSRIWMQDKRLSLKATGLLAKMLSMPPHWEFYQSQLLDMMPDGKDSLRSAMIELVKYGYLIKHQRKRKDNGHLSDPIYEVYDIPQLSKPLPDDVSENIFSIKPDWESIKIYYEIEQILEPKEDSPPLDKKSENQTADSPTAENPHLEVKQKPQERQQEDIVCCEAGSVEPASLEKTLSCFKLKSNGKKQRCDLQDLFAYALRNGHDWSTGEIKDAWNILLAYEGFINDWFKFIEGTIKNLRKENKSKQITSKNNKDEKCLNPVIEQENININSLAETMKAPPLATLFGPPKSKTESSNG